MSWTYEPALLETSTLFQVRLKVGDTREADPQLQDEEIQVFLDATGDNANAASLLAARALRAMYSRYVDKWVGDLKILASQRLRAYERLVDELEAAGGFFGRPWAGGIRVSEKEATEENDDLVSPSFKRGLHDNPDGC